MSAGQVKGLNRQRAAQAALRRADMLRLRASGLSTVAIAQHLDITPRSVDKGIARALSETVASAVDLYRALAVTRLEALLFACWDNAMGGDLAAIHAANRIIGQYVRLLGLEQPPAKQDDASDQFAALLKRVQEKYHAMERAKTPEQRAAEDAAEMEAFYQQYPDARPRMQPIIDAVPVAPEDEPDWARALKAATIGLIEAPQKGNEQ
jgi:hypothetical protein